MVNETIANNQWYDMKILLNGNTARLYVNGTFKAQYSYPATFSGGKVGFRAVNANSYFDNFLVSTAQIERTSYTLGGQAIATRVTGDPMTSNNGLFYLFSDHLGSTSVLATSTGSQVPGSKTAYYPFGSPRTTPTQTITDRNFTGQKENLELGLLYYNARFYLPGIARFASADTIVPDPAGPQQFNRYTYTLNNPLRYIDPSGHLSVDEIEAYFGYDANAALNSWGQELFNLLWDTELTWGDVFKYDDRNTMLVLFETREANSSIYRGGFWGLDGDNAGEEVWEYELKNSDDIEYNPGLTELYQELGWENLPRQTGSNGFNNYDPVVYSELTVGHIGAGATIVGAGATIVVGFACVSNPVGWIACLGGGAGLVAAGATGVGLVTTLISPPESIDYPLLRLPTLTGNAPRLWGFNKPNAYWG